MQMHVLLFYPPIKPVPAAAVPERSDDITMDMPAACTSAEGGDEDGVCAFLSSLKLDEVALRHSDRDEEEEEEREREVERVKEREREREMNLDPLMTVERALSGTAEKFRGR